MTPCYGLFWERCRDMSQQNFADRKASCERCVAFTLQNTFLKRCQVSGRGQDININITSVARKYFKHQRSSQCQISQMTQAVWHLQNVWTKMHTLIRKYFWYLSNVLFAKNKVHTGFCRVCQLWKLPSVKIKTWTPLLQWSIQTRSWFIYLCNHITYCLDIFYLLCTKPGF